MVALSPIFALVYVLGLPAGIGWAGSRRPLRRWLVPRGAPPRAVAAFAGLAMFVAMAAFVGSAPDDASDNAWLILVPGVWALGLCGLAFLISAALPVAARAGATSAVISALVVLCAINIALLAGWALSDDEDLNGNAIDAPLVRAAVILSVSAAAAIGVGQAATSRRSAAPRSVTNGQR